MKEVFFCKGHLEDLPIEIRSKINKRYCEDCYKVIEAEQKLVVIKFGKVKEDKPETIKVTKHKKVVKKSRKLIKRKVSKR